MKGKGLKSGRVRGNMSMLRFLIQFRLAEGRRKMPLRIMLLDFQYIWRLAIVYQLGEIGGYDVEEFESIEEARSQITEPFDVLVIRASFPSDATIVYGYDQSIDFCRKFRECHDLATIIVIDDRPISDKIRGMFLRENTTFFNTMTNPPEAILDLVNKTRRFAERNALGLFRS